MKKFLILLATAVAVAAPLGATPVMFPLKSFFYGANYTRGITITAVRPWLTDGNSIYAGSFITLTPTGGTNPIVELAPNDYTVALADVRTPLRFSVPDTNAVMNVLTLISNGLSSYSPVIIGSAPVAAGFGLISTPAGTSNTLSVNPSAVMVTGAAVAVEQLPISLVSEIGNGSQADAQIFGREYLGAWFSNLVANANVIVDFIGDSTTTGGGFTFGGYQIDQLFRSSVDYQKMTVYNSGMSGVSTVQWATNYNGNLATSISRNPTLIVIRYGINDWPNAVGFSNSLELGLVTIRATLPVSKTSILLETPNSINDQGTPARNITWNLQVDSIVRSLARKYSCAFIDVFPYLRDTTNSAFIWKSDKIHPVESANLQINDLHVRVLYPPAIAEIVGRRNPSGTSTRLPSDSPTNYPAGICYEHVNAGWPFDGGLFTERQVDGIWFQRLNGYNNNIVQWRTGGWSGWNPWQYPVTSVNFTNSNGVSTRLPSDAPSTWPIGISFEHVNSGWPYDGGLFTERQADGIWFQRLNGYNSPNVQWRTGGNSGWNAWQYPVTTGAIKISHFELSVVQDTWYDPASSTYAGTPGESAGPEYSPDCLYQNTTTIPIRRLFRVPSWATNVTGRFGVGCAPAGTLTNSIQFRSFDGTSRTYGPVQELVVAASPTTTAVNFTCALGTATNKVFYLNINVNTNGTKLLVGPIILDFQ